VKCLYFVSVGTLDELLWKLLEKKFQDLGEFVEGQEKLNIVVHHCYHGTKELLSIFNVDEAVDNDEEEKWDADDSDAEGEELLALEHDLERDIDLLGKEELTMILPEDDDEMNADGKPDQVVSQVDNSEPPLGRSEDEAILLSDDEDEAVKAGPTTQNHSASVAKPSGDIKSAPSGAIASAPSNESAGSFDVSGPLLNCRAYNLLFDGPSFGMQLLVFHQRLIVGSKVNHQHTKPNVGDILVAMNGQMFPFVTNLGEVIPYLKAAISRASVELTFVECDELSRFVKSKLEAEAKRRYAEVQARMAEQMKKSTRAGEVIDLLDDD
jgi:hypothetical protein